VARLLTLGVWPWCLFATRYDVRKAAAPAVLYYHSEGETRAGR